jgi:hypothetical protein
LRQDLEALALRVRRAMGLGTEEEKADAEAFHEESVRRVEDLLPEGRARHYFTTFPARSDWEGMRFHLARTPDARPDPDSE